VRIAAKNRAISPYLIVDDAQKLVDLLKIIFGATEFRRFDHENGTIAHIELELDDTILMISNYIWTLKLEINI